MAAVALLARPAAATLLFQAVLFQAGQGCLGLEPARASIRAGDLDAARRALESCVADAAGSRDPEAWHSLGVVAFAQRRFDQAAAALERSLALDPSRSEGHKLLGRVQTARGQPARAERAFVQAARLAPADAESRYLLGRLYQSQDRLVEAGRFLKQAVALDPAFARAHAFLGSVSDALGEAALAEESFARAAALNAAAKTPDAIPCLEHGVYLQRHDRLEESVRELRRAAELDGSSVEARFELGRSLHRLRRLEEAAIALRAALALDAFDPRVRYLLGRVCYEQGDRACGDEQMRLSERARGR